MLVKEVHMSVKQFLFGVIAAGSIILVPTVIGALPLGNPLVNISQILTRLLIEAKPS